MCDVSSAAVCCRESVKKLHIVACSTGESPMRILSTPVETENKSDVQNENKQVGTLVLPSPACAI